MGLRDDVFRVEMLGLHQVALSLVDAGYEVATPRWDSGVDVIAFRSTPRFVARPLQIKAAASFSFGVYRKYSRFPGLIMTYAMHLRGDDPAIYAMPYSDTVAIADSLAWTKTPSWIKGGAYSTRRTTGRLTALLEPWRMNAERWRRLLDAPEPASLSPRTS
jgi:hypothetical protein